MGLALRNGERLGVVSIVVWLLPQVAAVEYYRGDWASAGESLRRYRDLREITTARYTESQAEATRAAIAFGRGDADADVIWRRAVALGREMKDPQASLPALSGCARFLVESGRHEEARALYEECLHLDDDYFTALLDLGWVMYDLGLADATAWRGGAGSGAWRERTSREASSRSRQPSRADGPADRGGLRSAARCGGSPWSRSACAARIGAGVLPQRRRDGAGCPRGSPPAGLRLTFRDPEDPCRV